jgi:hypothetical protein
MKKITIFSLLICSVLFVNAQDKNSGKGNLKFSAGAELGLPIGDFGDAYSVGFGASAQGDYHLTEKLALTLNAGYITYSGKSIDLGILGSIKPDNFNFIPVLAGAKYWITDNFYGAAQAGLSFWSAGEINGSEFTFAPAVGYKFSQIDVQLKYNSVMAEGSSLNNLGLRVAYNF